MYKLYFVSKLGESSVYVLLPKDLVCVCSAQIFEKG